MRICAPVRVRRIAFAKCPIVVRSYPMIRSVYIIQPPLVQLNGPYPSGAYLASFFRMDVFGGAKPGSVRWIDANNRFFRYLFCARGICALFDACSAAALAEADALESAGQSAVGPLKSGAAAGSAADREASESRAYWLRRFVSERDSWTVWIDCIVRILCGSGREESHSFVRSPYAPRGPRSEAFLASLETDPSPDDSRMLATLSLEDLADFVTEAFDSEFSLVRYAESLASSVRSFADIEKALGKPVMREFLEPCVRELLAEIAAAEGPGSSCASDAGPEILFCVSVPFPGSLAGALATGRLIKEAFGSRAVVSMGGGYVNTELRSCTAKDLWKYVDCLSFDRGYGGYLALLRGLSPGRRRDDAVPRMLFCPEELAETERKLTGAVAPDYSDIDFSLYPRLADDPNPMHRLWSDGAWIKAYLAHGCYWHRCSFCDVTLDYINAYLPVGTQNLYRHLRTQCLSRNVRGIHLVDEAAPPRALRDFALENLQASREDPAGGLLSFWGNIRFEKTFTRDLADLLAAGGLAAVSGGIEIASPEGFKAVDKGIDLEHLVAVCAAFKEAGVLVHSYLIYGYWNEDAQGVADSAEVMRQLFAAGLVDSAFWHKFVLTRHSRVYAEYEQGLHRGAKGLEPVDSPGDFADNDLRFKGEDASSRYTTPLDAALSAWMSGDGLDKPVRAWFPFPMPAPRIAPALIETYIDAYEKKRDIERNASCDPAARYVWLAGKPVLASSGTELVWRHLGEETRLKVDAPLGSAIVEALARNTASASDSSALKALPRAVFRVLRHNGLVKISPL